MSDSSPPHSPSVEGLLYDDRLGARGDASSFNDCQTATAGQGGHTAKPGVNGSRVGTSQPTRRKWLSIGGQLSETGFGVHSRRGGPDRDVSQFVADGSDDGHDIHDVYDLQSDDSDDEDSDRDDGDDSDSDDDSDNSGTDGGDDGSDSDDSESHGDDGSDSDDNTKSDDDTNGYVRRDPDACQLRFVEDLMGYTDQFAMPDLQLGVIGCGEVARKQYLPHLSSLTGTTITAIADPSRDRLEHVGDQYGISHRYQRGAMLITEHRTELDGIVICSPPQTHASLATQALAAGLATLLVAPLAVTPEDTAKLRKQAQQSTAPAMVGYTRRYDPAYHQFGTVLEESGSVRHVDAFDVGFLNQRIGRTGYDLPPESLPEDVATRADRARTLQAKTALGTDVDWIVAEYLYHLKHLCHSVNLLRGLYGKVVEIRHASLGGPEAFLTAQLAYESGINCHLTAGRTDGQWSEEHIRVDTAEKMVRLDCSDPYRRDTPSKVTIKDGTDEVLTRTHVPTADEPIERELGAFLEAVRTGKQTQTPFTEAAMDVELIIELIKRGVADPDDPND